VKASLEEAQKLINKYYENKNPTERLGQFLLNNMKEVVDSELYYEECPRVALHLFMDRYVETC
jgi:hypothetical protein